MSTPLNKSHSIESASFVLAYEQPFSNQQIEALLSLEETLKKDLPFFKPLNILELKLETNGPATSTFGKAAGIHMQSVDDAGKQTWGLKVEGNHIIVSSFAYETWDKVSKKAIKLIKAAATLIAEEGNPINIVALQIIDKFICNNPEEYKINDVLDPKSVFLTKHSLKAGKLWHVYQGWFEESKVGSGVILNVLNMGTRETPDALVTALDHNVQLRAVISSNQPSDVKWLSLNFDELHKLNKAVISKALNEVQRKAINL